MLHPSISGCSASPSGKRIHTSVCYYENNGYLMKCICSVSILPKDAINPALLSYVTTSHFESFLVRHPALHTTNNRAPVQLTCGVGGEKRPHSNLFSLRSALDRRCVPVHSFQRIFKIGLPTVLYGRGHAKETGNRNATAISENCFHPELNTRY
jgi:hypothetical protein